MLVAGRQINVERAGKLVALNPGEAVPEAALWPHDVLMRCMKVGQVVNVERATQQQVAQAQASQTAASIRAQSVATKNVGLAEASELKKPLSTSEVNRAAAGIVKPAPKKSTSRANAAAVKKAVA